MNMRPAAGCVAVLLVSGCTNATEQSAVGAVSASNTASSTASSESLGTLFGSFPACIGPGVNVRPWSVVEVRQAGVLVKSVRVRTDEKHHDYRIALTSGDYEVRISVWPDDVKVEVRAGRAIEANLPGPSCL
jgi:hypothetical protein